MSDPVSKAEVIEQLRFVQQQVSAAVEPLSEAQFYRGTAEAWSACDYLKHLLLSNKPIAKALNLPPEQLERRFGQSPRPSMSFAELGDAYQARLDQGVRAEDYDLVVPATYRFPEGVEDVQQYLVQSWNETHDKLVSGLQNWDEAALDRCQVLHPAIGVITMREMLFFTIYHNTLHWRDIEFASQAV